MSIYAHDVDVGPDPLAMFEANKGLAYSLVRRCTRCRPGYDEEDVVQHGLFGLWEAAVSYNPNRGPFGAWAGRRIRWRMQASKVKPWALRWPAWATASRSSSWRR